MTSNKAKSYCSAFGCLNNDFSNPDLSFFTIPTEEKRRLQWLQSIDREDLSNKSKLGGRVCEIHFKADDIVVNSQRKRLRKNCLPRLHLPKNNEDKETQTDDPEESSELEIKREEIKEDIKQTIDCTPVEQSADSLQITPPSEIVDTNFQNTQLPSGSNQTDVNLINRKRPHEDDSEGDKTLESLEHSVNQLYTNKNREDEFQMFAMSVAAQLRQLPIHIAVDAQSKIQCILSDARIKSITSNALPTTTLIIKSEDCSD